MPIPSHRTATWNERVFDVLNNALVGSRQSLRVLSENETQFGENLVAEREPVIQLNSSYGFSALRDIQETTNTGSVADGQGTIDISTGTTANSRAALFSAEVGRYAPGYSAQIGLGIRSETAPTGEQVARWGGLGQDDLNGFYFGRDATDFFVARLDNGSETRVYRSDWNLDKLDGNGISEFDLDVTIGQIYQIEFSWYGYGQILFGVIGILPDDGSLQHFIPCHSLKVDGAPSVRSPNLRIFADVDNNGTAEDLLMHVGGRQYSIVGNRSPRVRYAHEFKASTNTSTEVIPLITFQRKSGFGDRSIKISGFEAIASQNPHIIEIRLDGTLDTAGATFSTPTNHTAAETAVEVNKAATQITGGIVVWQELISAGGGVNAQFAETTLDFDIPNGQTITLCARTLSGSGTIISGFRIQEEW